MVGNSESEPEIRRYRQLALSARSNPAWAGRLGDLGLLAFRRSGDGVAVGHRTRLELTFDMGLHKQKACTRTSHMAVTRQSR